jgi:hypothetical protein
MKKNKYEVWIADPIRKASLEEFAQLAISQRMKKVWFIETKGKKMLINFCMDSNQRILDDGTHILKRVVSGVIFTEVNAYKRMLIYDHFRGTISYSDKTEDSKRYETIIPVLRYPDNVVEFIAEVILKKEQKSRNKK